MTVDPDNPFAEFFGTFLVQPKWVAVPEWPLEPPEWDDETLARFEADLKRRLGE